MSFYTVNSYEVKAIKSATEVALLKLSAHDWSRTSTSVGHYPLKVARLPIPPREPTQKKLRQPP
jgi:hypothetical protein